MSAANEGFDTSVIKKYRQKMNDKGQNYLIVESDDNSEDYVNFYFIGMYEGREVIYDAVIYTLKMHYNSELYEIAEHKAAKHFPEYKKIKYEEDENGDLETLDDQEEEIGLYMAEVIMELEDEGEVTVQEHVDIDPNIDFGIGLDAVLNVESIDDNVIRQFVKDYNDESLVLDETPHSFLMEEDEKMM